MNQQPDTEWLHYRLRGKRSKLRAKKEALAKKLIALEKERRQLWQQQKALGWVPLVPPVQKGWKRFFVLRSDVARSKSAPFFEGILQKINTVQYSSRKDFKEKKRKAGRKIYVVKEQALLQPCEAHFRKLKLDERALQLFEVCYVKERWHKAPVKVYRFREPWRFVLRVRPNIITKVRARDEAIEQRLHQIAAYLERSGLIRKQHRLLWGSYGYRRMLQADLRYRNPMQNKSLNQFLYEQEL